MEISAQHEIFMDAYIETGNVREASEKAGFDPNYGKTLFHKLRDRILPRLEDEMAMMQVQAIKVYRDSMGDGAMNPKQEIRLRAASETMDRGGLTKKQTLDIQGSELPAVMILPAKAPQPASAEPVDLD